MPKTSDKTVAKKKVTKKTTTPVVETAPVVEKTVTPVETTGETTGTAGVETTLFEQFNEFMGKLQAVGSQFQSLKSEFRSLEKRCTRDFKIAQKSSAKGKRRSGNREPSGFVKPTAISKELATFLKKPEGTLMARTEVTKEINAYIRANSLQDKTNGRKIIPDTALTKLLKIGKTDELTYFNLQKFMSHHFPKKVVAVAEEKA